MKRFFKWAAITFAVLIAGGAVLGYTPDTDPAAMKARYATPPSRFIDLGDGTKVHIRDQGKADAPPLVLIHGSNASLHTWEPWVRLLGDQYRIITLDLPGHGLTGASPRGYTQAAYVDVVDAVMAKLGVTRAVIGGNSMGGGVSWAYALKHPAKVDALILLDAGGAPREPSKSMPIGFRVAQTPGLRNVMAYVTPRSMVASSLQSSVSVKSVASEAAVTRYWELLRYPGNRTATIARFADYGTAPTPVAALSAIKAPTLILWGEEDGVISVKSAYWFAKEIPGSKLIVYTGIGHLPMEEAPERSAADVRTWLAGLKR